MFFNIIDRSGRIFDRATDRAYALELAAFYGPDFQVSDDIPARALQRLRRSRRVRPMRSTAQGTMTPEAIRRLWAMLTLEIEEGRPLNFAAFQTLVAQAISTPSRGPTTEDECGYFDNLPGHLPKNSRLSRATGSWQADPAMLSRRHAPTPSPEDYKKAAEILGHLADEYEDELTDGVVRALIAHLRFLLRR